MLNQEANSSMGKLPDLGARTAVAKSMEEAISRHYNRLKEMEN
jgi:hypothetical protein